MDKNFLQKEKQKIVDILNSKEKISMFPNLRTKPDSCLHDVDLRILKSKPCFINIYFKVSKITITDKYILFKMYAYVCYYISLLYVCLNVYFEARASYEYFTEVKKK